MNRSSQRRRPTPRSTVMKRRCDTNLCFCVFMKLNCDNEDEPTIGKKDTKLERCANFVFSGLDRIDAWVNKGKVESRKDEDINS